MLEKTVGDLTVQMFTDGYPLPMTIRKYGGGDVRINHTDIQDLKYLVDWIEKNARMNVGDAYIHEVDGIRKDR